MYGLFWRKYMKVLPLPSYCINKCCENWSSPAYCWHRFMIGKSEYPVCPRSAALYNLKKLPAPPKQLELFFEF